MAKPPRALVLVVFALLPFLASADNPVAYRIGPGAQLTCTTTAPNHISTRGTIWCKSTDANNLHYTSPTGGDSVIGASSVVPQIITVSFSATDSATVTWSNLGGTQSIFMGPAIVTDGSGGVTFYLINKTTTGATLKASAPWTGTVALSVVSL